MPGLVALPHSVPSLVRFGCTRCSVPWTAAEHRIRATGAERATAAALDLAEGAPCLVIERRTWRASEPVTYVKLTYPADAHELVARFAPTQR